MVFYLKIISNDRLFFDLSPFIYLYLIFESVTTSKFYPAVNGTLRRVFAFNQGVLDEGKKGILIGTTTRICVFELKSYQSSLEHLYRIERKLQLRQLFEWTNSFVQFKDEALDLKGLKSTPARSAIRG